MISNFINNQYVRSQSERSQPVFDPATGKANNQVLLSSRSEVEEAIGVAQEAFSGWSATTPLNRARVLFKFFREKVVIY